MPSDIKRNAYQETTAHFLREIWDEQPTGYVELVAVNDAKPTRKSYWLRSDDDEHLAKILARHPWDDFYFTPHTFSDKRRVRDCALTPRLIHADVIVGTATPRAFKVWSVGDDLRKRAARDDAEYRLFDRQALWRAPEGASLRDIERLCQGKDPTVQSLRWAVTRLLAAPPPVLDAKALIRKYSIPVNMLMGHCEQGNRAKVCFNIAVRCMEHGMTFDQTRMIVEASGAFVSKAAEQGDRWGERELERLPGRALAVLERQRLRA